jgi:REP element-mobilizing transposase RayT
MARANRHYLPGYVWHITHRCHKREFLLKFSKDRQRWLQWLFEARRRYNLLILNYAVTSNHIHLLVFDKEGGEVIPRSIQLVAGQTAQEYNQRKNRKGAFWEDRYHATAVETGDHLRQCLIYIDLNMVRAGVVKHPSEWPFGGFHEIRQPRRKCRLIVHEHLLDLLGIATHEQLQEAHAHWIEEALARSRYYREDKWTSSIGVGSEEFVKKVKNDLGIRARGRKVVGETDDFVLREPGAPYDSLFETEKDDIGLDNDVYWDNYPEILNG